MSITNVDKCYRCKSRMDMLDYIELGMETSMCTVCADKLDKALKRLLSSRKR